MDNTLDRIYEMMFCELDDIAKKDKLDSKDVELIDKFVDIIKDIDDIGSSADMGYSQMNGNGMRGRSGRMMPMYGRGSSFSRGRSMNSREESKSMMLDHLADVMNMAVDDKDRRAVERLMQQMENN